MNTKRIALATLSLAALSLSATAFAPQNDIVDTAVAAGNFKTLVSLVKQADLVETLKGEGPFTVFAPTDAAFNKVPKATLKKLGADENLLRGVLTYHVVSGAVGSADVVKLNGKSVKTVNGAEIKISVKRGNVFLNNVQVVKTDIKTKNGIIHVINGVLIPPKTVSSMHASATTKSACGSGCGN